MFDFNQSEADLVNVLLEPLLDDFHYWLSRSRSLLLHEAIDFLGTEGQADLLAHIEQTLQSVMAARSMVKALSPQVGIDPPVLLQWHQLVTDCWQVMIQYRLRQLPQQEML